MVLLSPTAKTSTCPENNVLRHNPAFIISNISSGLFVCVFSLGVLLPNWRAVASFQLFRFPPLLHFFPFADQTVLISLFDVRNKPCKSEVVVPLEKEIGSFLYSDFLLVVNCA